jgi:hypothetical protein
MFDSEILQNVVTLVQFVGMMDGVGAKEKAMRHHVHRSKIIGYRGLRNNADMQSGERPRFRMVTNASLQEHMFKAIGGQGTRKTLPGQGAYGMYILSQSVNNDTPRFIRLGDPTYRATDTRRRNNLLRSI